MTIIRGYANYGVLAHEKQIIFTVNNKHEHADVSEEIEITIPDGWKVEKNNSGETLIESPDGNTYLAEEIIQSFGDNPILGWYDESEHRIKLDWKPV